MTLISLRICLADKWSCRKCCGPAHLMSSEQVWGENKVKLPNSCWSPGFIDSAWLRAWISLQWRATASSWAWSHFRSQKSYIGYYTGPLLHKLREMFRGIGLRLWGSSLTKIIHPQPILTDWLRTQGAQHQSEPNWSQSASTHSVSEGQNTLRESNL